MLKKLTIILIIAVIPVLSLIIIWQFFPDNVSAQETLNYPLQVPIGQLETVNDYTTYIPAIFKIAIGFLIVISVIIYIIGGFLYLSSAGRPGPVQKAKEYFVNASIGLAIGIFSYVIIYQINPELVRIRTPDLDQVNLKATNPCEAVEQSAPEGSKENACVKEAVCVYHNNECKHLGEIHCSLIDNQTTCSKISGCAWVSAENSPYIDLYTARTETITRAKEEDNEDAVNDYINQYILTSEANKCLSVKTSSSCPKEFLNNTQLWEPDKCDDNYTLKENACVSTGSSNITSDRLSLTTIYPCLSETDCNALGVIDLNLVNPSVSGTEIVSYRTQFDNNRCLLYGQANAFCGQTITNLPSLEAPECDSDLTCDTLSRRCKPKD